MNDPIELLIVAFEAELYEPDPLDGDEELVPVRLLTLDEVLDAICAEGRFRT